MSQSEFLNTEKNQVDVRIEEVSGGVVYIGVAFPSRELWVVRSNPTRV
jgi:hypothetical protein